MRWIFLLPRFYLGVIFLISAYGKLTAPVPFSKILVGVLTRSPLAAGAFPWYQSFLHGVVIPNAGLFGNLVVWGELYVGLAMLLGITTRLAAVVAVFLLANYMSMKGTMPWSPVSNDAADIVLAIVVFVTAAGRTFGLDRALHERFPATDPIA